MVKRREAHTWQILTPNRVASSKDFCTRPKGSQNGICWSHKCPTGHLGQGMCERKGKVATSRPWQALFRATCSSFTAPQSFLPREETRKMKALIKACLALFSTTFHFPSRYQQFVALMNLQRQTGSECTIASTTYFRIRNLGTCKHP